MSLLHKQRQRVRTYDYAVAEPRLMGEDSQVSIPDGAPTAHWLTQNSLGISRSFAVIVTPEMAEKWLSTNTNNRDLRKRHVASLQAQIVSGDWRLTHQGIAFSQDGRLIDGQHRLSAIVKSGVAAPLLVFPSEADDLFGVLDRGMKRSMRDHLLKDGRFVDACSFLARLLVGATHHVPNPTEVRELCDSLDQDFQALMNAAASNAKGRVSAPGRAAWMLRHHIANKADRETLCIQWDAFINLNLTLMDATTAAGIKRLDAIRGGSNGSNTQNERAAINWSMFDVTNRDMKRIILRDVSIQLAEIRKVTRFVLAAKEKNERLS